MRSVQKIAPMRTQKREGQNYSSLEPVSRKGGGIELDLEHQVEVCGLVL